MRMLKLFVTAVAVVHIGVAVGAGDPGRGEQRAVACFACHGPDGQSLLPEYPNLAGQKEMYIIAQLMSFKSGARKNPIMSPMAGPLSDQDIADIAAFFSGLMPARAAQTKKELDDTETRYEGAPSGVDADSALAAGTGGGNRAALGGSRDPCH